MNPTDPMTPVRVLIEAAEAFANPKASSRAATVAHRAVAATASISQLLSEHDKVVEYIKELQFLSGTLPFAKQCHDRLQSIMEGK